MKEIHSGLGGLLLGLKAADEVDLCTPVQYNAYTVFFIPAGTGTYHADFGVFNFKGSVLLFSTPLQMIYMEECGFLNCKMLQFHGDFYCIEFHREEVSCNGLLFNNIYVDPVVVLSDKEAGLFDLILTELNNELNEAAPSEITLRAYLQLFLAKSSAIKIKAIAENEDKPEKDEQMDRFRKLLDENFLTLHKPSDYAELLAMTPDNFTKRSTRYFKKTPSQLIQERLILEAKKQLHLTRKSIKEIAWNLKFQDEFYFSRVFKKFTKVSPQAFRDKTGISIVADRSKY
ncbi:helix-turn-helix domain-containing protein [Mucilaginibacter sp. X4EP1]|uniref:helix-turn-helix domain-containing protein n=1 Tax=Mucilaginibacter sp. X4EP1 TaxID=2723092 RepID=UPI0021676669|nr:AraC family transcriptional regulator [Mucilaginibacter sp. X4EP1]MCS3815528.1 AraC-like DNA-binding protein [Mucilaginibacter sp. X4EP1]